MIEASMSACPTRQVPKLSGPGNHSAVFKFRLLPPYPTGASPMKAPRAPAGPPVMLATPVLAQSAAEKTGVNSVMGVAPKTEDFITEAATSDMFEIESSKLAVERSSDAATKTFAQQMITDHT